MQISPCFFFLFFAMIGTYPEFDSNFPLKNYESNVFWCSFPAPSEATPAGLRLLRRSTTLGPQVSAAEVQRAHVQMHNLQRSLPVPHTHAGQFGAHAPHGHASKLFCSNSAQRRLNGVRSVTRAVTCGQSSTSSGTHQCLFILQRPLV